MIPNPFIYVHPPLVRSLVSGIVNVLVGSRQWLVPTDQEGVARVTTWHLVPPTLFPPEEPGSVPRVVFAHGPTIQLANAAGEMTSVSFVLTVDTPARSPGRMLVSGTTMREQVATVALHFHAVVLDAFANAPSGFRADLVDRLTAQLEHVVKHELVHVLDPSLTHGGRTSGSVMRDEGMLAGVDWLAPGSTFDDLADPEVEMRSATFAPADPQRRYYTDRREARAFGAQLAEEVVLRRAALRELAIAPETLHESVERAAQACADPVVRVWWTSCTPAQQRRFLRDVAALVGRELAPEDAL